MRAASGPGGWLAVALILAANAHAAAAQSIQGMVTAGGLHGNILALSSSGQSQTIQW
jgi:hypothetical protein